MKKAASMDELRHTEPKSTSQLKQQNVVSVSTSMITSLTGTKGVA